MERKKIIRSDKTKQKARIDIYFVSYLEEIISMSNYSLKIYAERFLRDFRQIPTNTVGYVAGYVALAEAKRRGFIKELGDNPPDGYLERLYGEMKPYPKPRQRAPVIANEESIVIEMKRSYDKLLDANRFSGVIDFPSLYREVKKKFHDLSIAEYKEILLNLNDNVVIDLQSVTDRRYLKEPEFGIPTSLGELYYVVWR